MKALGEILLVSFLSLLAGTAVLGGVTSGPMGILAAPVLMIFGWFYFPLVLGLQVIAYGLWPVLARWRFGRWILVLVGVIGAAALFSLIGIGEEGNGLRWRTGYALGAAVGAAGSCLWISRKSPTFPVR